MSGHKSLFFSTVFVIVCSCQAFFLDFLYLQDNSLLLSCRVNSIKMSATMPTVANPNETMGPMVITICIAFGVLTVATMALRCFARFYVTRAAGPDDCWCPLPRI